MSSFVRDPLADRSKQMRTRSDEEHYARRGTFAATYYPGNGQLGFSETILPIGRGIMACLWYMMREVDGRVRQYLPFRGYSAQPHPSSGEVYYGGKRGLEFSYNLALAPRPGATGAVMDSKRSRGLLARAVALDWADGKVLDRTWKLPAVPQFPQFLIGFGPKTLPEFEKTPALQVLAAERLCCEVEDLAHKEQVLMERQYRDMFEALIIKPGAPGNDTPHYFIDAEYCTRASMGLLFENYGPHLGYQTVDPRSSLLGHHVTNPARRVFAEERANPANRVLKALSIDTSTEGWEAAIDHEKLEELVTEMYKAIGAGQELFDRESVLDAICNRNEALKAPNSVQSPVERIGMDATVRAMKDLLPPDVKELVTWDDLKLAAQRPGEPLVLSGVARHQVMACQPLDPIEAFNFTQEVLGRRVWADLWVDHLIPREKRHHHAPHHAAARANS